MPTWLIVVAIIGVLLVAAVGALVLLARRAAMNSSADGDGESPLSLVFLLREPRVLDEDKVRARLSKAFGAEFTGDAENENAFVKLPPPPLYGLRVRGIALGVINSPDPYVPDPKAAAAEIDEVHLKQAMADHKAWIAVDWMGDVTPEIEEKAWRVVARVLAEFAGDDCLALYAPRLDKMNYYDPRLAAKLRGDDPLDALELDGGMVMTDPDDPALKAAVEEAKRRWPEFVQAFTNRAKDGDVPFIVKAPFSEGDDEELMWVEVNAIDGGYVRGTLGNQPGALKHVKKGDRVRIPEADVVDWLYAENGEAKGGFTAKVIGG